MVPTLTRFGPLSGMFSTPSRVIALLSGISKPMVCQAYGLHAGRHENVGHPENDENNEDNSAKNKEFSPCAPAEARR